MVITVYGTHSIHWLLRYSIYTQKNPFCPLMHWHRLASQEKKVIHLLQHDMEKIVEHALEN